MTRSEVIDAVWMTRRSALAQGFTHEGTHFGVPVFLIMEGEDGEEEISMVVAKSWPLEWVIDIGVYTLIFMNQFRAPDQQLDFPFLVREIPAVGGP